MMLSARATLLRQGRRARRKLMVGTFRLATSLGNRAHRAWLLRENIEVLRDIAYGEHQFQRLDIYRPQVAQRPMPVMLYLHGGAFTLGSKTSHRGIAVANAAGAQCLVVMIDYRLAPRFKFPAAHEDACLSYHWVLAHIAEYGGDPSRVVVAGESAGGNLALAVAVAACYPRPEPWAQAIYSRVPLAVQSIMPFLQVSNPSRRTIYPRAGWFSMKVVADVARAYLGHASGGASVEKMLADPIRVMEESGAPVQRFPPVFSGVGTADICCEDTQRLEAVCQRLAIPITTHYYEGEGHAFHALRWRTNTRLFWRDNFAFLRGVFNASPRAVP